MKDLFVDMDGTICEFHQVHNIETLFEKGYFLKLSPHDQVLSALKWINQHGYARIHILSSYLTESKYALEEKNKWLDYYFPSCESRFFLPCSQSKLDYVLSLNLKETKEYYLLDDYSCNLFDWTSDPTGKFHGIKLMNGINGTHGTWVGNKVYYNLAPSIICGDILKYLKASRVLERGRE